MKATDKAIIDSYAATKSVWKTGEQLDMCGQSVWERLRRLGIVTSDENAWTKQQIQVLTEAYSIDIAEPILLEDLAEIIGKHKTNVCRKAHELGLTTSKTRRKTPEYCKEFSERQAEWLKTHPHPRHKDRVFRTCPVCGCFFDELPSSKKKTCGKRCATKLTHGHPQTQGNQGYSKNGKRPDLNNQYFRSAWEANYARYLNLKGIKWEYEPETFEFFKIKKGVRFYTPDFRVHLTDGLNDWIEYHEIKGWDYAKGKTARNRFLKYYPGKILVLRDAKWYKHLIKDGFPALIPNWEF